MSCRIAARRLALLRPSPSSPWVPAARRAYASTKGDKQDLAPQKDEQDLSNPLLEKYLERKERENNAADADAKQPPPTPRYGAMSKHLSTIFTPEAAIPGWRDDLSPEQKAALKAKADARKKEVDSANELKLSEMTLDPDKKARRRLERRFVIKDVKRRGRMNKAQTLARTERQSLYRSHDLPASTKKLQKVMNQVAGKTVDEALVQLRFSKKKIARDVIKGIEMARNEAIVARGMGLGGGAAARKRWQAQRDNVTLSGADPGVAKAGEKERLLKPAKIELKDGSKKMVRDPTEIYIDQAWVSKGIMTKSAEFRARGRVNTLRHRSTSFSVLLKEEKTRMRISEEIKKKRDNRKLWVALPDRPVTAQRQYCLW